MFVHVGAPLFSLALDDLTVEPRGTLLVIDTFTIADGRFSSLPFTQSAAGSFPSLASPDVESIYMQISTIKRETKELMARRTRVYPGNGQLDRSPGHIVYREEFTGLLNTRTR